ncbi:MAG: hypothetical protein ACM3YF_00470 [Candidatus Zixiibacteriota bacterium]
MKDWLKNGWLVEHQTSRREIADLLGLAERDLSDCRAYGLSPDWQLAIAYNAALQAGTAALAAAGYRAARGDHHYRVIQSLTFTIQANPKLVAEFDQFRKKRNISGYDRAGSTSEQEAQEMEVLARKITELVKDWIRKNHPKLL